MANGERVYNNRRTRVGNGRGVIVRLFAEGHATYNANGMIRVDGVGLSHGSKIDKVRKVATGDNPGVQPSVAQKLEVQLVNKRTGAAIIMVPAGGLPINSIIDPILPHGGTGNRGDVLCVKVLFDKGIFTIDGMSTAMVPLQGCLLSKLGDKGSEGMGKNGKALSHRLARSAGAPPSLVQQKRVGVRTLVDELQDDILVMIVRNVKENQHSIINDGRCH